jgi:hypothetical protein
MMLASVGRRMRDSSGRRLWRSVTLAAALLIFCQITVRGKGDTKADLQSLAITEMQNIATAEDLAYLDIDYYVSIENLDDLAYGSPIHYFDDINDGGGTAVIDLRTARFKPERVNLLAPVLKWKGPYITYDEGRITLTGNDYDVGTLLDFWGNPYYLFTPAGLARPPSMSVTLDFYGDAFDTYAIVSLGPDGVKSDDDLKVYFGVPPTSLAITSASPSPAEAGGIITIKGYNFGDSRGDSRVEINGIEIAQIDSWSGREILAHIPSDARSGMLSVVVGETRSNEIFVEIRIPTAAASEWTLYF